MIRHFDESDMKDNRQSIYAKEAAELFEACSTDNITKVSELLSRIDKKKLDVNSEKFQIPYGNFLVGAINIRSYRIIDYIIQWGKLDITKRDYNGMTPFHAACKNGNKDLVKKLYEINQNIDLNELLRWHIQNNKLFGVIDVLISLGADNKNRAGEETFLHIASSAGNKKSIEHFISKKKFDINIVDENGQTPLYHAAKSNNQYISVPYLVDRGAKVDWIDNNGDTPLMALLRAKSVHISCFLKLIEAGASIESTNNAGETIYSILFDRKSQPTKVLEYLMKQKLTK